MGYFADGKVGQAGYLASADDDYDDAYPPRCSNPSGHEWVCTGTSYGGDDERWMGEGRIYCVWCGADGDA